MKYLTYLWSCIKWSYSKLEGKEPIIAYIIPVLSYIFSLVGLTGIVSAIWESNYIWLTAVVPILVMIIFVAPYKIWRKTNDELIQITTKRFELSLPPPNKVEGKHPFGGEWSQEWYRIKVHNPTALPISGCYGKLFEFTSKLPYSNLPSPGLMFPWSSFSSVGRLAKIASNDSDYLDIFAFDGKFISIVILDPNTGKRDLSQCACLIDEYDLIVQVGSQDEAFSPTYALIRIKPYVENFKERLEVIAVNYNPDCLTRLE